VLARGGNVYCVVTVSQVDEGGDEARLTEGDGASMVMSYDTDVSKW
jgi:hypothetical protein